MSRTITASAITGGNLFLDGVGRVGELVSCELPAFEHETLEVSTAIGKHELVLPTLKAMSAKFTVSDVNKAYFDLMNTSERQNIFIKANKSQMDGVEVGIITTFEGFVKVLNAPNYEMNKEAQLTFEVSCTLVKYEINKETVLLHDVENSFYNVGGVDIFEKIRKNIF